MLFDKNRETLLFYPSGKQEKKLYCTEWSDNNKRICFSEQKFGRSDIASFFKNIRTMCFTVYKYIKQLQIPDNVILPDDSDRQSGLVLPNSVNICYNF